MASAFKDIPEECREAEKRVLRGEIPSYICQGSEFDLEGTAEGILVGGNLSTFSAVLNTAYSCTSMEEPFILFLEEVEEDYEHIHRYLTVLEHFGVLDRAAGILFGEWINYPAECETYNGNSRGGRFQSAAEMVSREFMADRDIPVAFGFPAGHGDANYPLLMGTKVKLAISEKSYSLEWLNPTE
jgi:muramoyltetrapeptide carboxypeptidase